MSLSFRKVAAPSPGAGLPSSVLFFSDSMLKYMAGCCSRRGSTLIDVVEWQNLFWWSGSTVAEILEAAGILLRRETRHVVLAKERRDHRAFIDRMNMEIRRANQLLEELCQVYGFTTFISHDDFDEYLNDFLCADGLHFSRLGIKKMAASLFENIKPEPIRVCEEQLDVDDYDCNYPPLSNCTRPVEVTDEFPHSYSSICAFQPALSEPKSESLVISWRRTRKITRVTTDDSNNIQPSKKKHLSRRHMRKPTTLKNIDFRTTNRYDCLTVEKVKKAIWVGEKTSTYTCTAVHQPARKLECWCNRFHYETDMELLDHVIDHHVPSEKLLRDATEQDSTRKGQE
ncbi:uncharacterized protein LOC141909149 [Tubulanus polymorphus]|uniref:uncharacterized protein LOC141909149 n=1 Tax=Tubulanus polymorphus TaxID=672921 RepID=UPI003DA41D35